MLGVTHTAMGTERSKPAPHCRQHPLFAQGEIIVQHQSQTKLPTKMPQDYLAKPAHMGHPEIKGITVIPPPVMLPKERFASTLPSTEVEGDILPHPQRIAQGMTHWITQVFPCIAVITHKGMRRSPLVSRPIVCGHPRRRRQALPHLPQALPEPPLSIPRLSSLILSHEEALQIVSQVEVNALYHRQLLDAAHPAVAMDILQDVVYLVLVQTRYLHQLLQRSNIYVKRLLCQLVKMLISLFH